MPGMASCLGAGRPDRRSGAAAARVGPCAGCRHAWLLPGDFLPRPLRPNRCIFLCMVRRFRPRRAAASPLCEAGWVPQEDVLVLLPHCWFPITAATVKADEDQIPLFGWKDDGWLDMPNSPSMDPTEPVKQFLKWKAEGFKIRRVGHDKKFARKRRSD